MKTKRTLSLFLALSLAVSLTVPAMAAEETPALPGAEAMADVLEPAGLAGLYDQFTLDFAAQYKLDHPEEYAAFDAGAWFEQEWDFYSDKAEYMADMGLATEEEFWEDMWVEYTTYTEEYEVAWQAWWAQEEAREVEEYRAAHPGELEGLDLTTLLARRGYREPLAAYMEDYGLATEEEARNRLLAEYVSSRRLAQERRDQAEAYRAADPESWESFDVDAYLAQEWGWYTKEEFMASWHGPFYSEEELADYLYIEFMEGQRGLWNWGWENDGGPTLVVNGVAVYDAGLTTADGVSYLPAGELGAILGADLAGEEPVAIREAALAAGWDVTWNSYCNQVVLLDRETLLSGLDLSRFEALVNRALSAREWEEGKTYRTTNTYDMTLTAFNSLDGDKTYDLTVKADMLMGDNAVDLTLTANAAQLLELLPQASLDKLGAELGKASFRDLKTLLTGCKLQVLLDMENGQISWNVPLLALVDDTVTENTWFTAAVDTTDAAVFARTFAALQSGEWSLGEVLYDALLKNSAESYLGAEDSYSDFVELSGMMDVFFGEKTVSERGGTLTWKVDADMVNGALAGLADLDGYDDDGQEGATVSLFKEYKLELSVDRNGRMTADVAVRPDMEGIAAMATQGSWYDAGETALMTWILGLLDFKETAHSEGTASRSAGTAQFHWKNQFKLELDTSSTRAESRTAPRTTPPAGAEVVEL